MDNDEKVQCIITISKKHIETADNGLDSAVLLESIEDEVITTCGIESSKTMVYDSGGGVYLLVVLITNNRAIIIGTELISLVVTGGVFDNMKDFIDKYTAYDESCISEEMIYEFRI